MSNVLSAAASTGDIMSSLRHKSHFPPRMRRRPHPTRYRRGAGHRRRHDAGRTDLAGFGQIRQQRVTAAGKRVPKNSTACYGIERTKRGFAAGVLVHGRAPPGWVLTLWNRSTKYGDDAS